MGVEIGVPVYKHTECCEDETQGSVRKTLGLNLVRRSLEVVITASPQRRAERYLLERFGFQRVRGKRPATTPAQ